MKEIPTFNEKSECILNERSNLRLIRIYDDERSTGNSKKYLKIITILQNNTIICDNFASCVLFKEELADFSSEDDSSNIYFKISYRKVNGLDSKKFQPKFGDKKFYFSKAECKAIIYIWNMALQGYSCVKLCENISYLENFLATTHTSLRLE